MLTLEKQQLFPVYTLNSKKRDRKQLCFLQQELSSGVAFQDDRCIKMAFKMVFVI